MEFKIMSENILSSTGGLGTSERPENRLYCNSESPLENPLDARQQFEELVTAGEENESDISRVVLRGVATDDVVRSIRHSDLSKDLEVAMPLNEYDRPGWLIYLARNASSRQLLVPVDVMLADTIPESYLETKFTPSERVINTVNSDVSIRTDLRPQDFDGLYELWGPVFGWTRNPGDDQIAGLANRLINQSANPNERDVWFAASHYAGQIVAAAMAERITLPGLDGKLDLVENTEWCVRKNDGQNFRGRHLITPVLATVNSMVLNSLSEMPNGRPLIYAECNFMSRSDRAGHAIGFRIPEREIANQINVQNVSVGDGQNPVGLRDFSFMRLPQSIIDNWYSERQLQKIYDSITSGHLS